jgi:pyruvate/2-oxoglutarate dehydrogenase complex dihydrolipoamide dehydrogenase (E3) component
MRSTWRAAPPISGWWIDGPVRADMARVKARKDAISEQSRAGVEETLKALKNCTVYRGHARFAAPHKVVGEALLTAERIFINVGGRAVVPTWPDLEQVAYLTNSSMMAVDFLPRLLWSSGAAMSGSNSPTCTGALAAR